MRLDNSDFTMSLRGGVSNNIYVNSQASPHRVYVNDDQQAPLVSGLGDYTADRSYQNLTCASDVPQSHYAAPTRSRKCCSAPSGQKTYNVSRIQACNTSKSSNVSPSCRKKKAVGVCHPIQKTCEPESPRCRADSDRLVTSPAHTPACQLTVNLPPLLPALWEASKTAPTSVASSTSSSGSSSPDVSSKSKSSSGSAPPEVKDALAKACQNTELGSDQWSTTRLQDACSQLEQCNFYFGRISMAEGKKKLASCQTGTFLLRTSSDPLFLFSLSIKTPRGTTSIRIAFKDGIFRLDSEPGLASKLPGFTSVVALVQHYQTMSCRSSSANSIVFLESSGRKDTPVMLTRAYREKPASLCHLSRLAVNNVYRSGPDQKLVPPARMLEPQIISYLEKYPFAV